MRIRNSGLKVTIALILLSVVALASVTDSQLANLLISHVGQERAKELMKLPRVSEAPFLLITPNLRYAAVCDYYAGGDSIKVEVIFDYRGKK